MIGKSRPGSVIRDGNPPAERFPWLEGLKTTQEFHSEILVGIDVCCVKALSRFIPIRVELREKYALVPFRDGSFLYFLKKILERAVVNMLEIRVPATSANMGPGFDCLGVALNLYNCFHIEECEDGLYIDGCEETYKNENNLVFASMQKCFEKIGYKHRGKGLRISFRSDIPMSRGLGSSAACILGGVLAANEIGKGKLSKNEILEIASEIEGHPDNIAPALFGGMTVSIKDGNQVYYEKINLPQGLKFCAIIPDFKLSTKDSRAVLPDNIPYRDGVYNVGRVSLLIAALSNGNFDLLKLACKDRLHEVYRSSLISNYNEIVEECNRLNSLCVFLSGAGPTIMAVLKGEDVTFRKRMEAYLLKLGNKWIIKELKSDTDGASVKIIRQNKLPR